MKYIISNYNNELSWVKDYTDDYIVYDQSNTSDLPNTLKRPHIGTDIYDKLSFIIDNYDNLPDVLVLVKGNLWKFISKEEFEDVKNNKTFTPLLTKHHKTRFPISFYSKDGMYNEINNRWFVKHSKFKNKNSVSELYKLLGLNWKLYLRFAPGSNYIVPKENIFKHSKSFYEKLRSYLDWNEYPGEGYIIERALYYIWK